MKHPYLVYLLAVVAPAGVAVGAAFHAANVSWQGVQATSDARVAGAVLASFQQDLGHTVDSLLSVATADTTLDPSDPTVARAMGGDTVSGMRLSATGREIFVLAPGGDGDPAGSVRLAEGPLPRRETQQVGRATAYAVTLYLGGHRWSGTEPPVGPDTLAHATALDAAHAGDSGVTVTDGGRTGALVALRGGADASVAAFAMPRETTRSIIPIPLLLVMALLLLFATLAGWIQTAGGPTQGAAARSRALLLLSAVPVLTAGAFMVQAGRLFREGVETAGIKDLTRGVAVASVRHATGSPEQVRILTGLDATLVRGGRVVASTFDESLEGLAPLAGVPAPPASFIASGRVPTPKGPAAYVALREGSDGMLVATAPTNEGAIRDLLMRQRMVALAYFGWLLVLGTLVGAQFMRSRSSSSKGPTSGAVS